MIKRYYLDSGLDPCPSCVFTEDEDGEWVKWEDVGRVLDRLEDTLDELCDHAEQTKDLAWTLQVQVAREDNS